MTGPQSRRRLGRPLATDTSPLDVGAPHTAPRVIPRARRGRQPSREPTPVMHPRWILLVAPVYMLAALVGIALHVYYLTHPCSLGSLQSLCQLDTIPPLYQVVAIFAAFGLGLLLVVVATRGRDPEALARQARDEAGPLAPMWRLTEYPRVRGLAWLLAVIVLIGLFVNAFGGRLDTGTLGLGIITMLATLQCATYLSTQPRRRGGAR